MIPELLPANLTEVEIQKKLTELSDYKYAIDESSIVAITDTKGTITYVNDTFCKISKYSAKELIGQDHRILNSGYHPKEYIRDLWVTIANGKVWRGEIRNRAKDGSIYWVDATIVPFLDENKKPYQYLAIRTDITEKKLAQEAAKESEEKYRKSLIKLNETKDKFISILSHDLRTPFSSIMGFTDLLLNDDELSEEEKKQYVGFIQESSKSMLDLVNSLLDWARIQTGRIKFEPEILNAEKIILNCINSLSGAALQKNLEIKSEVEQNISIYADKSFLTQVFNNLISNSIKFTNPGGKIVISACPSAKKGFYEFSVRDNGVGIKPENQKDLFRIETKYSSEGTAGEKGTGLGLSLVKEILEKHGGNIWVESEYGKGSNFKFILPVASVNILLVDDSKSDRLLYSRILQKISSDYNVEIASNGEEALQMIIASPPALVITDHLMPEMNGYELILKIKKLDIARIPPVIILSNDIESSTIDDYTKIGVEYVFNKPVNISVFKTAVEKSLKKALI
jgi:PAS domain S-box-containing protein